MASALLPSRRELTLLLLALSTFFAAYNFEAYVRPLNDVRSKVPTDLASSTSFSARALLALRAAGVPIFRDDGRRAPHFSDGVEQAIVGDWDDSVRPTHSLGPGGVSEDQQHRDWSNGDMLVTELVAHVPGYTVLDNVLLMEGTLYLVHDHAAQVFPKPEAIISHGLDSQYPSVMQDLRFLTRHQALEMLGYDAHRFTGVSILSLDHAPLIDNQTLLALHRAYASVASYAPDGETLLPPALTIFANLKYADVAHSAYDMKLSRLAFPYMNYLFADDWSDFEKAGRPVLFDRVLISDRVSAELGANGFDFEADVVMPKAGNTEAEDDKDSMGKKAKEVALPVLVKTTIEATDKRLSFAPPFALPARADWAAPIYAGLSTLIGVSAGDRTNKAPTRTVTYVSTQNRRGAAAGARLRDADHEALVKALRGISGATVHVIELGEPGTGWAEAARAAAQSTVMLGVYGDALANVVLMARPPANSKSNSKAYSWSSKASTGPKPTVIEFFPDGKFTNEHEFVARALEMEYVAWRNTKKYTRDSLPPISPPTLADSKTLSIDVNAVVHFVKDQLAKKH